MIRLLAASGILLAACGPARVDDVPMLGGRPDRNMVSAGKNLPATFDKRNIKWVADLGNQTYGNPVIAGGRVFIGTNNENPRDPSVKGDRGVLMCFAEADGSFLWQAVHAKLPTGEAEDWPKIGICSTPCVVGDRVYYVSNRAELVCCDVAGFSDGENDGPIKDENRRGAQDADLVWVLDMKADLGVMLNQAAASSPLVVDGRVFVVTGQARDLEKKKVENPEAPSFIAVDAVTGKVAWKDNSPGAGILSGQWASPSYGVVDGKPQVAFPGGDGRLYVFDPATGTLLWKSDATGAGTPDEERNYLVAMPAYAGDHILIAEGQDPQMGDGPGCLRAFDARKGTELWRVERKAFGRTICTAAVHEGLVTIAELAGYVRCFELATGKQLWVHDTKQEVWGSPLVADGKVYVRTDDGDVIVFKAGRELKILATNTLPGLGNGAVVVANGVLYIAGDAKLYAIQ